MAERLLAAAALAGACAAGCGDGESPPIAELPAWDKTLPSARVMGERRGLAPARGIVHLHSPYSHDACDGAPRAADGTPNEPCIQSLRKALCTTKIDFANLTDHDASMADEEFTTLFSMRGTDEPVMRGDDQVASRITCDDGHQVLLTVGGENAVMPIMLDRHVPGTAEERHATYNGTSEASITAFREAGGLVWIPHTENATLDFLRAVEPDGLEVYNLHANLDPQIRRDHLGLDPAGAIAAAAEFADTNPGHPEPDLALISFLTPNLPAIERWHELLAEGRHVAVTAGSDAHENAFPVAFADGERGDSYRRVLRWFSNVALVEDPSNVDHLEAALRTGRNFTVFEVLGTPGGFDVHAVTPSNQVVELGGTIPASEGAMLTVDLPRVYALDPSLPTPTVRARVLWIEPGGTAHVIRDGESSFEPQLRANLGAPGAYRVEITIVPRHLGPYLGNLGPEMAEVELPWIYTSPIYVE
jgi:hypothetical protein